jgi:protein phosphatase
LLRGGRLEQVTTDQTVAQQLVERGALSPAEAKESRWSHVLWNCIGGGNAELSVEVSKGLLQLGDTLLLCTDGLTNRVPDEPIREMLLHARGSEEVCRRLVQAANEAGGSDNITVLVARFREAGPEALHAQEEAALPVGAGLAEPAAANLVM